MFRLVISVFLFFGIVGVAAYSAGTLFERDIPKMLTTNVDPARKMILDEDTEMRAPSEVSERLSAFADFIRTLSSVANPSVTQVRIRPGMRKEEIAELLTDKFDWTADDREAFLEAPRLAYTGASGKEGVLYPGIYLLPKDAAGATVRDAMAKRFSEEVVARYASSTRKIVGLETVLKIASLIEREASPSDTRLVSGVIWNRLFKEMSLDIDATLQYVKGNAENGWWPRVVPSDKRIDSPYNTYEYEGLPPTAISNPSLSSIVAALNPKKTQYLYYLHDRYGRFHGAATYKEHLRNIERYLK